MSGTKEMSYEERLTFLGLPTLYFRRLRGDMIQVYKYFHNMYDIDWNKMLPSACSNMTRGHQFKIVKTRTCTTNRLRKQFFSQRIVNDWNLLPREIVTAS